jgi:putative transposase
MTAQRRKTIRHFNDPGHAHFLTFSCYRKLPLLSRDRTRQWLMEAIGAARVKHGFALLGYVIMPEHAHLVVRFLLPLYDIATLLKSIKQPVARKAKRFLEEQHPDWLTKLTVMRGPRAVFRFWQSGPGYDRNIRDQIDLSVKIAYMHNNPVRRGLVTAPEGWEWSSAGWYIGKRDGPVKIDNEWVARTNKFVHAT